jgi:hypothetical protein
MRGMSCFKDQLQCWCDLCLGVTVILLPGVAAEGPVPQPRVSKDFQ